MKSLLILSLILNFSRQAVLPKQQNERKLIGVTEICGTWLLGYLTGKFAGQYNGEWEEQYCEKNQALHKADKTKELEILYYYHNTYLKDIRNKCKIAIRVSLRNVSDEEFRPIYLRCTHFHNFVQQQLGQNSKFFKPEYAALQFRIAMERNFVDFSDLEETPEKIKVNNKKFIDILQQDIDQSVKQEEKDRTFVSFDYLHDFYEQKLYEIYDDVLKNGKLNRKNVYLDGYEILALQQIYNVDPEKAIEEFNRIQNFDNFQEPENGFSNTDNWTLYQFYQDGWDTPLLEFNTVLKYINQSNFSLS